jgi:hypothetical protein
VGEKNVAYLPINIKISWVVRVAQMVEHLLSKHEALCSNPGTTKKQQKKIFLEELKTNIG